MTAIHQASKAQNLPPASAADTATKSYVDTSVSTLAPLAAPVFTGVVTAPTLRTTNGTPTAGYVLTSDNTGVGYGVWSPAPVVSVAGKTGVVTLAEADVTNLVSDLAAKAPLASPTFTGRVTVPTPSYPTDAATKTYVDAGTVPPMLSILGTPMTPSQLNSPCFHGASFSSMVNGQLSGLRAYAARTCTIDGLSLYVSTAGSAGSVIRVGIYQINTSATGVPSMTLLGTPTSTISGTATGGVMAVLSSAITVPQGTHLWVAAVSQGAPTTPPQMTIAQSPDQFITGPTTDGQAYVLYTCWTVSGVTGALPSTLTLSSSPALIPANAGSPVVMMHVSA